MEARRRRAARACAASAASCISVWTCAHFSQAFSPPGSDLSPLAFNLSTSLQCKSPGSVWVWNDRAQLADIGAEVVAVAQFVACSTVCEVAYCFIDDVSSANEEEKDGFQTLIEKIVLSEPFLTK